MFERGGQGGEYVPITELAGNPISEEQLQRMVNRYVWAGRLVEGLDVLEVGCGSGQGLQYLGSKAKTLTAGDFSEAVLSNARQLGLKGVRLERFDAQDMPFSAESFDAIILFEAIYYIPDLELFFAEAARTLRTGGVLLLATANKDLFDFNPSPHSFEYLGVCELGERLSAHGFDTSFFGDTPTDRVSLRQRILRPLKALAVRLNLMPKTTHGKAWLKRIVFGSLMPMPPSIDDETLPYQAPVPIDSSLPDRRHKVIFCLARMRPAVASQ